MRSWGTRSGPTTFCRLQTGKLKASAQLPATHGKRVLSSALTLPLTSITETLARSKEALVYSPKTEMQTPGVGLFLLLLKILAWGW